MNREEFELCLDDFKGYHIQGGMCAGDMEFVLSYLKEFYVWASNEQSAETLIDPKVAALFFIEHFSGIASIAATSEKGFKLASDGLSKAKDWSDKVVPLIKDQSALIESRAEFSDVLLSSAKSLFEQKKELANKLGCISKGASNGGKEAALNRVKVRNKVQLEIKQTIQKQYLWNDATQTTRSITDALWSEIKTAIDSGEGWQGISREDLLQGKVGRNTVQDIVKETDPR